MAPQLHPEPAPSERSPGRPRAPEVDQRILDAALRLMAQQGYARMSMEAIAAEAAVTKPTIYRRYPGKERLAIAAIIAYCETEPPRYTGDTWADLVAQMQHFRRALERPFGMGMLGTVLAEEHETPELLQHFRTYLVQPRRQEVHALLTRASKRSELRSGANIDLATNMLIGAYYAQYLAGTPFPDNWSQLIVDAVRAGIGAITPDS